MDKIEHVGIAVSDLEEGIRRYETILQTGCYKREVVESQGVETAFFKIGESKIELLSALSPASVIYTYIEKKGEGFHHIAYEVLDIRKEMRRFAAQGYRLLSEEPLHGADNKLVCFIHTKDASGVLTELVQ